MNPRTNIFSGFGVYTKIDNPDRGTFIRGGTVVSPSPHMSVFSGMGAAECQQGYMEFPAGSGVCVPTISMPSSGCQPGTTEPWPGAGFCLPTTMPSGQPPMIPGPCPSGMFGVPPYCFPMGTPLPPGATPPPVAVPAPAPPPPVPPPTTGAPAAGSDGQAWVVPVVVGVGIVALVGIAVSSRRRATPNRRRRVRRRR